MNSQSQTRAKLPDAPPGFARALRVGFVPLVDAAPLIVASELGLFRQFGLNVQLERVVGWATVRDKILYRELDAAHALVGLPFAATLGAGSARAECVTGLILNAHGNAVTLSRTLWERGVRTAKALKFEVEAEWRNRTFTFGVVHPFSTHHALLRDWLVAGGIDPDQDVRIITLPPPQMPGNLEMGNLDGFCVGEPWNSEAVARGCGCVAATSADLAPLHPEKVLMVRQDFAETSREEHVRLVAAVLAACRWCQNAGNRPELVRLLARPRFLNVAPDLLERSLVGPFALGGGRENAADQFHLFYRPDVNRPSPERAEFVIRMLQLSRIQVSAARACQNVFRADVFDEAVERLDQTTTTNSPIHTTPHDPNTLSEPLATR